LQYIFVKLITAFGLLITDRCFNYGKQASMTWSKRAYFVRSLLSAALFLSMTSHHFGFGNLRLGLMKFCFNSYRYILKISLFYTARIGMLYISLARKTNITKEII